MNKWLRADQFIAILMSTSLSLLHTLVEVRPTDMDHILVVLTFGSVQASIYSDQYRQVSLVQQKQDAIHVYWR